MAVNDNEEEALGLAREGRNDEGQGPSRTKSEVQSVKRACQLLAALAGEPRLPRSALELSQATGLNRTVVHRLLRTLVHEGLVEERNGRYAVGPRTVDWSHGYVDRIGIRRAALPYGISLLRSLAGTPWIVSLAVPAWSSAILIDRLWNPEAPFDSLLDIGTRLPFATSAVGRCMLAYSPLSSPGHLPDEPAPELARRLDEIRSAGGVDWSSEELRPGIGALAAVILSYDGLPIGALAVSGPELDGELRPDSDVARQLHRTAQAISQALP